MTPDEYCRAHASARGSSGYYSVLFLPAQRRRAVAALWAYCREIDGAVRAAGDSAVAGAKLDWWQGEVERLYTGVPQHPVTRALAPQLAAFGIPRTGLLEVLEGRRRELAQTRILDFAGLARHGQLVAGSASAMAAGIFGAGSALTSAATRSYAHKLGLALLLIAILRNVGSDARRGRIYLPLDELQHFGVKAADLLAARYTEGFVPLMRFQAQRARAALAEALAELPAAEVRAQRPGLILAALYSNLLQELEREDFGVLHQHIALTPLRKLALAWRIWVFGYRRIERSPIRSPID